MYRRRPWIRHDRLIDERSTGFVNPVYSATADGGEISWTEPARADDGDGNLQKNLPETIDPASLSIEKGARDGVGEGVKMDDPEGDSIA